MLLLEICTLYYVISNQILDTIMDELLAKLNLIDEQVLLMILLSSNIYFINRIKSRYPRFNNRINNISNEKFYKSRPYLYNIYINLMNEMGDADFYGSQDDINMINIR